jgi:hypothetical protein
MTLSTLVARHFDYAQASAAAKLNWIESVLELAGGAEDHPLRDHSHLLD